MSAKWAVPPSASVPWGDSTANTIIGIAQVLPFTDLAIPESDAPNQLLRIDYNIGSWGGFTHAFSDGLNWLSQDWTQHNAFRFWLYGNNTGQIIQIEFFDNRLSDSNADTAERFFFQLVDDYEGWAQITIPFAFFQRRADWQPGGAPDDGFNLDAVWGYAFGFPANVGAQTAYLDDVEIVVVEDPDANSKRRSEPRYRSRGRCDLPPILWTQGLSNRIGIGGEDDGHEEVAGMSSSAKH